MCGCQNTSKPYAGHLLVRCNYDSILWHHVQEERYNRGLACFIDPDMGARDVTGLPFVAI
jgi:hypothetical protein